MFKSNVTRLVYISKIVDQPLNTAVALSRMRAGKLVAAQTKSSFLQFRLLFSFKNKNGAPKETFCSSYKSKMKLEKVCIFALILVNNLNLFCFSNCGLFCLCYITKHLMTAPSTGLRLGKDQDSRETKQMFP